MVKKILTFLHKKKCLVFSKRNRPLNCRHRIMMRNELDIGWLLDINS